MQEAPGAALPPRRCAVSLEKFFILCLNTMNTFIVTITQAGGMSDDQMRACEEYFQKLNVKMIVSREQHNSGLWHLHSVVEDSNKRAFGFKRKLVRALDPPVDFSSKNALDVKIVKTGQESRTAGYVAKDGNIYVSKGWDIKSLLAQRAKQLQKDVDKKLVSTFMLNEKNCEEIILEYVHRMSLTLKCKEDFVDVMAKMAVEGYSVSRIKPCVVYAQVMARSGSPEYMKDWWRMKLGAQI